MIVNGVTLPDRYSISKAILDGNARQIMRLTGSKEKIKPETFEEKLKTVSYAPNGTQWTASNIEFPEGYVPIAITEYGNGLFVGAFSYGNMETWEVTGGMGLMYSEDGKIWKQSNITSGDYGVIKYCDGIWLAGPNVIGTIGQLLYSEDGKIWYPTNLTSSAKNFVYANGLIMAYSGYDGDGVYYSKDGKTWTQSLTTGCDVILNANGIWVASFYGGGAVGFKYSEDGKTWTNSNITDEFAYRIHYNGGIFVANTATYLYWSEDGKTWTQSMATRYSHRKGYGNGVWVVGHNSNGIYYSEDGKTWTQSNITSGDFASAAITYADGIFVLVSKDSQGIYYSTDGKVWTLSDLQTGTFSEVIHNHGIFLVTDIDEEKLYYSVDGAQWKTCNISGDCLFGVPPIYGKNTWIGLDTNATTMGGKLCYSVGWELPA